jgi:hypothetical protein
MEPKTIVIVEDEPNEQVKLCALAKNEGYKPVVVSSLEQVRPGYAAFRSTVRLVVHDLGLPGAKRLPGSNYFEPSQGLRAWDIGQEELRRYGHWNVQAIARTKLPPNQFLLVTLRWGFAGYWWKEDEKTGPEGQLVLVKALEELERGQLVLSVPGTLEAALAIVSAGPDPDRWNRFGGVQEQEIEELLHACRRLSAATLTPGARRLLDAVLRDRAYDLEMSPGLRDSADRLLSNALAMTAAETELYYGLWAGMNQREIADFRRVDLDAIKQQLKRLRLKVAKFLGPEYSGELTPAVLVDVLRKYATFKADEIRIRRRAIQWLSNRAMNRGEEQRRTA